MSVTQTLHHELAAHRRAGHSFDEAWDLSVPVALNVDCNPGDWLHIFTATRGAWESGYYRQHPTRLERSAAGLNGRTEGASAEEMICGRLVA